MNKDKKIKLIKGLLIALITLIVGLCIYIFTLPSIEFTSEKVNVEINDTFDPMSIVEKVRKETIEDIIVNDESLDTTKLGTYIIQYTLVDDTFDIEINVVDTIAPTFDVKDGETDATIAIDPSSLVSNIVDATNTVVSFKEDYSFDSEGDYEYVICVSDEANNTAEKTVKIKILPKDETAPTINGKDTLTLYVNSTFDPLSDMSVSDNQDPNPTLKVVSNDVDVKKAGTYTVTYEASDRSNNKQTFTKTVKVINEKKTQYTGEKIVYLTFDDGPSYNTGKVLDILDRYGVKATFFVAGYSSTHRQYIKQAYDAGHTIGLHTYTHDYADVYKSIDAYFEDLQEISDVVYSLTGYRSPYIRFPGGSSNAISKNYCKGIMSKLVVEVHNRGYEYYDWNVSSADASGSYVSASKIIKAATNASSGTLMILFHDTYGKDTTVEALPSIIEYYLDLGYEFKAIDDETYGFHHGLNN